jgi:hypothetical protein
LAVAITIIVEQADQADQGEVRELRVILRQVVALQQLIKDMQEAVQQVMWLLGPVVAVEALEPWEQTDPLLQQEGQE